MSLQLQPMAWADGRSVSAPATVPCSACGGTGWRERWYRSAEPERERCPVCRGTGRAR